LVSTLFTVVFSEMLLMIFSSMTIWFID
jgi:hypothetical protein